MGFLAIVVTHSMRACLSIAITEMVVQSNNTGKGNESLICGTDSRSVEIIDDTIAVNIFLKLEINLYSLIKFLIC